MKTLCGDMKADGRRTSLPQQKKRRRKFKVPLHEIAKK